MNLSEISFKKTITIMGYYLLKINFTHVYRNLLKVSRSRKKIVMPKLLPKNDPTNLFFYPEK